MSTDPREQKEPSEAAILRAFYIDVCREAERIMEHTGTVSGAHWNAMKRVLKRRGVQIDGEAHA